MLGDTFSRPGGHSIEGYSEQYICPQGFSGQYRVMLRKIWGDTTAGKVTVELTTHFGTQQEKTQKQQLTMRNKEALVLFELKDGRRQEQLREQQIANIIQEQQALSRVAITQQLNSYEHSDASRKYAVSSSKATKDGRLGGRRGVGFQPVITLLPSGAVLAASAVISADRRYVRVTPSPLFSSIGEVSTFTFTQ